jgi:hypothetical protein
MYGQRRTHILALLCGSSSLTLGLGAAGVVAAVLVILLLLLGASTEHGEHGRRGDCGLVLALGGLRLLGLDLLGRLIGVLGRRHFCRVSETVM